MITALLFCHLCLFLKISSADLSVADLSVANLINVKNLTLRQMKSACNREQAVYKSKQDEQT